MVLALPTLNKAVQVDTIRSFYQSATANTNYRVVFQDVWLDRSTWEVSTDLDIQQLKLEALYTAFDKALSNLWTFNIVGTTHQFTRRHWNDFNFPDPMTGGTPITVPDTFPGRIYSFAVYGDYILADDDTGTVRIYQYDPASHTIVDANKTITLPGHAPTSSPRFSYLDVGSTYFIYQRVGSTSQASGVYLRSLDADGAPVLGERVSTQIAMGIANIGSRRDLIIAALGIQDSGAGGRLVFSGYTESTLATATLRDGAQLKEENDAPAAVTQLLASPGGTIQGFFRSVTFVGALATPFDPTQVDEDGLESFGQVVVTPVEYSLRTQSIDMETVGNGVNTFSTQRVYNNPGAGQTTFILQDYKPQHLLVSGWYFDHRGVRYRVDRIFTSDEDIVGIFNMSLV